jgi:hypothetical protein
MQTAPSMIALFACSAGFFLYALFGIAWVGRRDGVKIWGWAVILVGLQEISMMKRSIYGL